MSVRKTLFVCVLALFVTLPLVGCNGSTDKAKPSGGRSIPSPTSNTTNAE